MKMIYSNPLTYRNPRMIMSIDGAAAMRAVADPHTNQMTSSGPKVDESLSSQLGGRTFFNLAVRFK